MSPAAKEVPLSRLNLPSDLNAIAQEIGAETAADLLIRLTPSPFAEDREKTLPLRLETRLTETQRSWVEIALERLRKGERTAVREEADRWTACCGGWCEALVRDGTDLLQTDSGTQTLFRNLKWPRSGCIHPPRPASPTPWAALTPEQRQALLSCAAWLLTTGEVRTFFPVGSLKEGDVSLAVTLYLQKLPPEYVLRIRQEREPGLTMEELLQRRNRLVMRIAAIGLDILAAPPMANQTEWSKFQKNPPPLPTAAVDNPTWYVDTIRDLFPRLPVGWTPPDIPFCDEWYGSVMEEVSQPVAGSLPEGRVFLFDPSFSRRTLADAARKAQVPLRRIENFLTDTRQLLKKKELRDLFLEPPPHGTCFEWNFIRYIPGEIYPSTQLEMLHLAPKTLTRLRQTTSIRTVSDLAIFLWGDEDWRETGIEILGLHNYYSLRAYLNYLNLHAGADSLIRQLNHTGRYRMLGSYLLQPDMELTQEDELALSLAAKRCLLGYQEVKDFDPSQAGWMAINAVAVFHILPKTTDRILQKRDLSLGTDVQTYLDSTSRLLTPVLLEAIHRNRQDLSRCTDSERTELLQRLTDRIAG